MIFRISRVKINSSKMKFDIMADDQRYLNFFLSLIIQSLLDIFNVNDSPQRLPERAACRHSASRAWFGGAFFYPRISLIQDAFETSQ